MFINLKETPNPMPTICDALGKVKILRRTFDAVFGVMQAVQLVYMAEIDRGLHDKNKAAESLCVACADMLNCLDALVELGLLDRNGAQFVGRYLRGQWHKQVMEHGQAD